MHRGATVGEGVVQGERTRGGLVEGVQRGGGTRGYFPARRKAGAVDGFHCVEAKSSVTQ